MARSTQISFTFRTKGTPYKGGNGLTAREWKRGRGLVDRYQRDYAVEIYFKNVPVGHGSRFTMGELAQHLMVDGQYSRSFAKHRRGPIPSTQKMVDRKNGIAVRTPEGKYVLISSRFHKKVWNFVDNAAKKHQNWRHAINSMTSYIIKTALARQNYLRRHGGHNVNLEGITNYYRLMQNLGRQIVDDCREALLALQAPPLEESTIKRKKHDRILQESMALYKAISYRVVKVDPKRGKVPIYFGKLASFSTGKDKYGNAYFTGSAKEAFAQGLREQDAIREFKENGRFSSSDEGYYSEGQGGYDRSGYSHDRDYEGRSDYE